MAVPALLLTLLATAIYLGGIYAASFMFKDKPVGLAESVIVVLWPLSLVVLLILWILVPIFRAFDR